MRRPLFPLLIAGLAVGVIALGGIAVRTALAPVLQARQFLSNPLGFFTRTPSGPVVLAQVQQLSRLETCRYQGEVVVQGEHGSVLPAWLHGDRMLFVGRGEVVAGVDLARLRPEDISTRGEQVAVRLPEPELFHTRLDSGTSEVYDRNVGLFGGADPQLETRVRREAETRLRDAAMQHGVLRTAATNAQQALRRQLAALGFRDVRFL
jgi:hypothetical protein